MVTSSAPLPELRWFNADDVVAGMPSLDERIRLAEVTMTAFARAGAAEMPPKMAIHPRPEASFVHAMPAQLRVSGAGGSDEGPARDLIGMKWVAGYATNTALGLPAISAIVVVNDPETGIPTAILDGGPITAQRTAAVSGLAIERFGPAERRGLDVALIGTGVQGHSHLPVLAHLLPDLTLHLFDASPERAEAFADTARAMPWVRDVRVHRSAREAIEPAGVVVTAASFGAPEDRQAMTNDWLRDDVTVVPIDYDTYCAATVARDAALFLTDQREQFLATRAGGYFSGFPDPAATLGEAIVAGTVRPSGRVVVAHLGVGLADLVFADAIVRNATAQGRGTILAR